MSRRHLRRSHSAGTEGTPWINCRKEHVRCPQALGCHWVNPRVASVLEARPESGVGQHWRGRKEPREPSYVYDSINGKLRQMGGNKFALLRLCAQQKRSLCGLQVIQPKPHRCNLPPPRALGHQEVLLLRPAGLCPQQQPLDRVLPLLGAGAPSLHR